MQPGRDIEVGYRRFQLPAGVIVEQHLAPLRHPGQGEDAVDRAAGDGAGCSERPVRGHGGHERDLPAAGGGDLGLEVLPGIGCKA